MSQYLNFFIKKDKFILIAEYSRSTQIYQEVKAPYEKIKKFSEQNLREIADRLRAGKKFDKTQIDLCKEKINIVGQMPDPIEDKLEIIQNYFNYIEEYEEDIAYLDKYANEIDFIANMTDYCDIYAGIEISDPTEKDIIDY